MSIESREIAVVDQALRRHPRSNNLRFSVAADQIEVFERRAANVNDLLATFGISDPDSPPATGGPVGFRAIVRFVLQNEEKRFFQAERLVAGEWEPVGGPAPIHFVAKRVIGQLPRAET